MDLGPDLQYQVCVSVYVEYLKANQKMVGYPHDTVPLLHHWTYFATLVVIVVHKVHS